MGAVASIGKKKKIQRNQEENRCVQDEARSFRSKLGAIKFMTKNVHSRHAFGKFLTHNPKLEFLTCYSEIEDMKLLDDDHIMEQAQALILKYKLMNDCATATDDANTPEVPAILVWDKLLKLRNLDLKNTTKRQLITTLGMVENELLTELCDPFQEFLRSPAYAEWQEFMVEKQKMRIATHNDHHDSAHIPIKPTGSVHNPNITPVIPSPFVTKEGHPSKRIHGIRASQEFKGIVPG